MSTSTDPHQLEPDPFPRRKRSDDNDLPANSPEPTRKRSRYNDTVNEYTSLREVYIIGDDEEPVTTMRGGGTTEDPIQFLEWNSENIITIVDESVISLSSDDEDDEGLISLLSDDEDNGDTPSIVRQSIESSQGATSPAFSALEQNLTYDSDISLDDASQRFHTPLSLSSDILSLPSLSSTPVHRSVNGSETNSDDDNERFLTPLGVSPDALLSPSSSSKTTATLCTSSAVSPRASTVIGEHSALLDSPKSSQSDLARSDEEEPPAQEEELGTNEEFSCCVVIDGDFDDEEEDEEALARISRQIPLWEDWLHNDEIKVEPEDSEAESIHEEQQDIQPTQPARKSPSPIAHKPSIHQSPSPPRTPSRENHHTGHPIPPFSPLQAPNSQTFREESPTDAQEARRQALEKTRAFTIHKKRLFYKHYAQTHLPILRARLANQIANYVQMPPTNPQSLCHIHTGLEGLKTNCIPFHVKFKHDSVTLKLQLNLGVINLLVNNRLSDRDIDGLVNDWWHVSHLCGNWRCVNVEHIIAEPGHVNVNRNRCLRPGKGGRVEVCLHVPRCLVEHTAPIAEGDRARAKLRAKKGGVGAADESAQDDGLV
ncbi:hypothetical protein DM02DRAFT_422715 [Periconia macrospinosa]|uniref:Zinc-binding loop region of homing endonuclease domain-containing protein n=1 Tax=Periconia macrospinosa TaxID=97972 RepID=A0A2V1E7B4_9PLEO|nr:hypothetical protein DM02DRAFT_422715 [Periconia macrospinosa]